MSTRYNTGNPIESTDVRDMSDNAKNFDDFANSKSNEFTDRFGVERKTIHGMNSQFDSHILNMGFTRVGTFAAGATLTNPRQTLLWDIADGGDGQEYGWSGSFPPSGKVVSPGSTPLTTGGIAVGAWISRFDPELRIVVMETLRRSYAESGYILVDGSFQAGGVVGAATDVLLDESMGIAYSWGGALPKYVSTGSTPADSGGIGPSGWQNAEKTLRSDLSVNGSTINGFIRAESGSVVRLFVERFTSEGVMVKDFGAIADGTLHQLSERFSSLTEAQIEFPFVTSMSQSIDWAAAQAATNIAIAQAASLIIGGSPAEVTYKTGAFASVIFDRGVYNFGFDAVMLPAQSTRVNIEWRSDSGAAIIGDNLFNLNGGASKNKFFKLLFGLAQKAIRLDTSNNNESMLIIEQCESHGNDVFLDTVSYADSRSTMVHIKDTVCGDTRVFVDHYTDHMRIENSWMYAKKGSYDAMLRLSGDGNVTIDSCFFIPHGQQITTPSNSRFIDFISDPANGAISDRSIKQLKITNCRMSLESSRGFIWTYDTTGVKPDGNNQVSSIVIEDTYVGGTGGLPVVNYKQGYPGSVVMRNCRALASSNIVHSDAGNTNKPIPSTPGSLTFHVIEIDEATRLSQSNSNNSSALVDPQLEPFVYDTTTQTSKYKRSIRKNIDYRLGCSSAGSGFVKCTLPIYFDNQNAASNRDLLSFMVITVSDAGATPAAGRAMAASIVSLVALNQSGVDYKKLKVSTLQDAKGGIGESASAVCTAHFGQANTGTDYIVSNASNIGESEVTIKFAGNSPDVCWVYVIPLAGLRENQQDKMQYGVW